jgi:hypothetical protein
MVATRKEPIRKWLLNSAAQKMLGTPNGIALAAPAGVSVAMPRFIESSAQRAKPAKRTKEES